MPPDPPHPALPAATGARAPAAVAIPPRPNPVTDIASGSLRRVLEGHRAILSNAGSLCGTSVATSLLGFAFWWLAARLFPPSAVGYGSAAVSTMTLLSTIGMLGLGTVLIGELARRPQGSGGLVSASLLASGTASAVLALGFVLVTPYVTTRPVPFAANVYTVVLFALGVALTGVTAVLDEALLGLLLGTLDLLRNLTFCVAKLAALALVAIVVHDQFGVSILAAWVTGSVVSVLVLALLLRRRGIRVVHVPQWMVLRRLSRNAASHSWLNLVLQTPQAAIPIVATGLVSATAGGSFFVAWMIISLAYMVPTHLSTVLYAIGAADKAALQRGIRFTLRLSLLGGLIGVPLLFACASLGLHLFGTTYAELATLPLRLLAFGYFAVVFKVHYVAVCRVHGRVARAAAFMTAASLLELGAAASGAIIGDLVGLSLALLAAMSLEGMLVIRSVLRAASAHISPPHDFPPAYGMDQPPSKASKSKTRPRPEATEGSTRRC